MRRAVFPGSFDPITLGHENIIRRALPMFDEIVVAVGVNSTKKTKFTLEQRMEMLRLVFKDVPQILENVEVKDKSVIDSNNCKKTIKLANKLLNGKGRLLVRKSGTESKIRIMAESNSNKLNIKCINIIKKTIK